MSCILEIDISPKPRPRIRVVGRSRFYPQDYTNWRKEFLMKIEDEIYRLEPESLPLIKKDGKVELKIKLFYKKLPKYRSHDLDSMAGGIMDMLTSIGYDDDSQVSRLIVERKQSKEDKIRIYIGEIK